MNLLEQCLNEDLWLSDKTLDFCLQSAGIDPERRLEFAVVAREPGCFSGEAIVRELEALSDGNFCVKRSLVEGETFAKAEKILVAEGALARVLSVERSLLNLLQHSSAVATLTHQLVQQIQAAARAEGMAAPALLHTRKTIPGLKDFQICAVLAGGGQAHRRDLSSGYLFKENHKYLSAHFGVGFAEFLEKISSCLPKRDVQVEVETEAEYAEALRAGVKRVLLDNFSPDRVRNLLARKPADLEVEVSGGIHPGNLSGYVLPGVDRISVGFLTHSVKALDLGLDWEV